MPGTFLLGKIWELRDPWSTRRYYVLNVTVGKKIVFWRRIEEVNNWSTKYYVSTIYRFHIILKAALPITEFQVIFVLFEILDPSVADFEAQEFWGRHWYSITSGDTYS